MLAARCQRFYQAGEPTAWLHMPLVQLAFFAAEIAGLQAEESLRRIQELRIAFAPAGDDGDSHRLAERQWTEQARRADRDEPQEQPKITKAQYDTQLAMVGLSRKEWVMDSTQ